MTDHKQIDQIGEIIRNYLKDNTLFENEIDALASLIYNGIEIDRKMLVNYIHLDIMASPQVKRYLIADTIADNKDNVLVVII